MAKSITRKITLHIDENTYQLLTTLSQKRGESMSAVARKILSNNLESEVALDAQDVLVTAVRKAVGIELRKTENRLANLSAKAAITSATTENLTTYILKRMNEPNLQNVREAARKRGVAYIREPLEQIMNAYTGDEEGGI